MRPARFTLIAITAVPLSGTLPFSGVTESAAKAGLPPTEGVTFSWETGVTIAIKPTDTPPAFDNVMTPDDSFALMVTVVLFALTEAAAVFASAVMVFASAVPLANAVPVPFANAVPVPFALTVLAAFVAPTAVAVLFVACVAA